MRELPFLPSNLAARIKASKTELFRQGVTIYLGRTTYCICPDAAVLSNLVKRGRTPGSWFIFVDGRYLTHDRFIKAVRDAICIALSGIDAFKYAGHSFRIGATTTLTAASSGVQDSLIRTMGWWECSVYTLYICTPRDKISKVAATLVGPRTPVVARNCLMQMEVDITRAS